MNKKENYTIILVIIVCLLVSVLINTSEKVYGHTEVYRIEGIRDFKYQAGLYANGSMQHKTFTYLQWHSEFKVWEPKQISIGYQNSYDVLFIDYNPSFPEVYIDVYRSDSYTKYIVHLPYNYKLL